MKGQPYTKAEKPKGFPEVPEKDRFIPLKFDKILIDVKVNSKIVFGKDYKFRCPDCDEYYTGEHLCAEMEANSWNDKNEFP